MVGYQRLKTSIIFDLIAEICQQCKRVLTVGPTIFQMMFTFAYLFYFRKTLEEESMPMYLKVFIRVRGFLGF